jgi:hypothetical protein
MNAGCNGGPIQSRAVRHPRRRAHGFFQRFDAAQPAAAASRQTALAPLQRIETFARNQPLQADAAFGLQHVHQLELTGTFDDPFGKREAECEVFQIARGRHHHRERHAVVEQRDRRFLDHPIQHFLPAVAADALGARRGQAPHRFDRTHRPPSFRHGFPEV